MLRTVRLRRRGIPPAVRAAVIERDGMECRHCGREVMLWDGATGYHAGLLHLDHVTPWAMGGADDEGNLVVSCAGCNLARPKPARGSSANNRLLWELEEGQYYWRDPKYRPPGSLRYANPDTLFTVDEAAQILTRSPLDVLILITHGTLRATTGVSRPIRVTFEGWRASLIEQRMDELGWEA